MKHEGYIGYGDEQDRRDILIPDCNAQAATQQFFFLIFISKFHVFIFNVVCGCFFNSLNYTDDGKTPTKFNLHLQSLIHQQLQVNASSTLHTIVLDVLGPCPAFDVYQDAGDGL